MLHKVTADQLGVGMYVTDVGISWMKSPYLYSTEGKILSESVLRTIREQGYREAYIDLLRSDVGSLPPELAARLPGSPVSNFREPPPPTAAFEEEVHKAKGIYNSSMHYVRNLMDNMRNGNLDMPSAAPVVEDILHSVDRNQDALFGLCKLRQADSYTYTHCINVSVLAVIFARGLGANTDQLHAIGMGGLFHDLGKSLVPLRILNAPRRLTESEFEVMKRHPKLGYDQIKSVTGVPVEVLQIIIEHHEKYNGAGYPERLGDKAISFAGKISAIVDVYDALTSRRIYKEALPLSKSLSILYSMRGKDFHPNYVEHFIRLLGVYPIGSAIELEDGSRGVVCQTNATKPLCPRVKLVKDNKGNSLGGEEIDLAAPGAPHVSRSIDGADLGIDPARVLGLL